MSRSSSKLYPRSCPICRVTWFTNFMDPRLTCGNDRCRQEARRRGIPLYKYDPFHNQESLSARPGEVAQKNQI